MSTVLSDTISTADTLSLLDQRLRRLPSWIIHNADRLRPSEGVGALSRPLAADLKGFGHAGNLFDRHAHQRLAAGAIRDAAAELFL